VRRRRRGAGVLAAVALVLGAGACAGSDGPEPLSFWNPLTGDDGAFMAQIVEEYNATNPEIEVNFMPAPGADMYTRLYSVARTGDDIPDLLLLNSPRVPELARSGILDPATSLAENEPTLTEENYLSTAWDAVVVDDEVWGIPLDLHGIVTFYNNDLLEQYDIEHVLDDGLVSVDELMELEGRLDDGHYAITPIFLPALVQNFVFGQGDGVSESDGTLDMTGDRWVRALEALTALHEAGLVAPEDSDSASVFNSGNAVFMADGTWGASGHAAIDGLDYGMTNVVQLDADDPVNVLDAHVFAQMHDPTRDPERDRAVAAFLEHVRTSSLVWAEAGQAVASRDVYEQDAYQDFAQSFLTAPEQEDVLATDTFEYGPYVMDELYSSTNDIVYGRFTVDVCLERMNSRVGARIEMMELA
jgi:multiple sugar transport system substrate-binding protein